MPRRPEAPEPPGSTDALLRPDGVPLTYRRPETPPPEPTPEPEPEPAEDKEPE